MLAGWSGAGLGAKGDGSYEPVSSNIQVRDSNERFMGIGTNVGGNPDDPFEQFRRNRSTSYKSAVCYVRLSVDGMFWSLTCMRGCNVVYMTWAVLAQRECLALNFGYAADSCR